MSTRSSKLTSKEFSPLYWRNYLTSKKKGNGLDRWKVDAIHAPDTVTLCVERERMRHMVGWKKRVYSTFEVIKAMKGTKNLSNKYIKRLNLSEAGSVFAIDTRTINNYKSMNWLSYRLTAFCQILFKTVQLLLL